MSTFCSGTLCLSARSLARWMTGPSASSIAERNAQLNHTRVRIDGCQNDLTLGGEIRVAAGYVGDERWFIFEVKRHGGFN